MSKKDDMLDRLDDSYTRFRDAFAELPDTHMTEPAFEGWNLCDVVAHLAGWNRVASSTLERIARGERLSPSGVDYSDTKSWNEHFISERRGEPPEAVIDDLDKSFSTFRASVDAMPEDWFEARRIHVGLLLIETDHYLEHATQITRWRESLS